MNLKLFNVFSPPEQHEQAEVQQEREAPKQDKDDDDASESLTSSPFDNVATKAEPQKSKSVISAGQYIVEVMQHCSGLAWNCTSRLLAVSFEYSLTQ